MLNRTALRRMKTGYGIDVAEDCEAEAKSRV